MNQGKYAFSQIKTFLPTRVFDRCIQRFSVAISGDKWVKYFTCWNQHLYMMFGQLSNRESLQLQIRLDTSMSIK
jgi:hypothetical protein